MFYLIYVAFTLFWCVLLAVGSLRGGLAEGNRIAVAQAV